MDARSVFRPVLRLPFRSKSVISASFVQPMRNLTTTSSTQALPSIPPSTFTTLGNRLQRAGRLNNDPTSLQNNGGSKFPQARQPWHLHCFAHKHNTHLTLTRPNREVVISVSCGQIGFKKAGRGGYDPAYQLGAYFMAKLQRGGWAHKIDELEFVLRGFGQGREAITKLITGSEGAALRHKITKVTDATRLKFGGTRSPRQRRLG